MPGYVKNSKIRLYINRHLKSGVEILLDKDESHYLLNVMRLGAGEEVALFNGVDGEWSATITQSSKKIACAIIHAELRPQSIEPDVWLVFAPIKKARIDFIAQKATELGASKLVPIMTKHTAMERVKLERLQANAKESAEQCGRLQVPEVMDVMKFDVLMASWPQDRLIMFCDEGLSGSSAIEVLKSQSNDISSKWAIFIGPEGGWSEDERQILKKQKGCVVVSLGPRVLRADTAAISALTLFQSILGDW
jgi:16S rRNA (uracil1498-N3)-methyltransferase